MCGAYTFPSPCRQKVPRINKKSRSFVVGVDEGRGNFAIYEKSVHEGKINERKVTSNASDSLCTYVARMPTEQNSSSEVSTSVHTRLVSTIIRLFYTCISSLSFPLLHSFPQYHSPTPTHSLPSYNTDHSF